MCLRDLEEGIQSYNKFALAAADQNPECLWYADEQE